MSITAKPLFSAKYAADTTPNTEYTTPSGKRTIVDKFTATNTDTATQTISINIVANTGSNGADNLIVKNKSIIAGATADLTEMQNQILASGDFIDVVASIADKIVIRASGRELS